ncbi:MAG TPA: TerB family tellurite resistance protein [Woeseiaceae bacterium]|nr:TerB family tellurite resistance protein [Woeseiaceae bacterium]
MTDKSMKTTLSGDELVVATADGPVRYDQKFLVAALLVHVAKGSGQIEPEESSLMIDLLEEYFHLQAAESLELITYAMNEMRDKPELAASLAELAATLSDRNKEDICLMGLKVVAADGQRKAEEMEQLNGAIEALGIAPDIVHRAFDRYFAETMPDTGEPL